MTVVPGWGSIASEIASLNASHRRYTRRFAQANGEELESCTSWPLYLPNLMLPLCTGGQNSIHRGPSCTLLENWTLQHEGPQDTVQFAVLLRTNAGKGLQQGRSPTTRSLPGLFFGCAGRRGNPNLHAQTTLSSAGIPRPSVRNVRGQTKGTFRRRRGGRDEMR